jgi:hypothetical protein
MVYCRSAVHFVLDSAVVWGKAMSGSVLITISTLHGLVQCLHVAYRALLRAKFRGEDDEQVIDAIAQIEGILNELSNQKERP